MSISMKLPKDILAYHATLSGEDRRICEVLGDVIEKHFAAKGTVAEGVECKVWHRHPVWFIDGNPIVGYHILKGNAKRGEAGCVRLMFWSGQSFDEPALPADPPGTKFRTAAARFASVDDIPAKDLKRWLNKAVEIQWDYKNLIKRKGKLVRLELDRPRTGDHAKKSAAITPRSSPARAPAGRSAPATRRPRSG